MQIELTWWDTNTKEKFIESLQDANKAVERLEEILLDYGRKSIDYKIIVMELKLDELRLLAREKEKTK